MNIAIVEDCRADATQLCEYIDKYFENSMLSYDVSQYESGEQFLKFEGAQNADVVFLDIFMQGASGIDIARSIRANNDKCIIVFSSTSNNFAAESYEVNAMQYLVKPYGYARFESVMRKVDEQIKKSDCYIDLKKKNDVVRILLSNIEYVDYDNHYIQIHTKHEMITSYLVKFCEIQDTLLRYKNFIWAYRNVIVNMDKVAKIEKKNFILLSGEAVPINSEKFADIKEKYHDYIFEKIERGE